MIKVSETAKNKVVELMKMTALIHQPTMFVLVLKVVAALACLMI